MRKLLIWVVATIAVIILNLGLVETQKEQQLYTSQKSKSYVCEIPSSPSFQFDYSTKPPTLVHCNYGPVLLADKFLSENVWVVHKIKKRADFCTEELDFGFFGDENHPQLFSICYERNSIHIVNDVDQLIYQGNWGIIGTNGFMQIGLFGSLLNFLPDYFANGGYTFKYLVPANDLGFDAVIEILGKDKTDSYYIELKEFI